MAYLREIQRYRCALCRTAWATVEAINDRNAAVGAYCKRCGSKALRRIEADRKARLEREAGEALAL